MLASYIQGVGPTGAQLCEEFISHMSSLLKICDTLQQKPLLIL